MTHCPTCGQPLISGECNRCASRAVFRIVQKEFVMLILLAACTIPTFLFTRSMAARNRTMNVDTGRKWFERGQGELQAGHTQEAIDDFRRATTNDHDNGTYTMALATALGAAGHVEEARQALLRLRSAAPESGEINVDLARLAAQEGNIPEAVRYYHNALYGVWPPSQLVNERQRVRTELVQFLLASGQTDQALSELLILSSDIPDRPEAYDSVGELFFEAGDSQHALDEFHRALRLESKDVRALIGAGRASFNRADYKGALRYLEAAAADGGVAGEAADLLETVRLVLSLDPLAPGIRTEERVRRLSDGLAFASAGLERCLVAEQGNGDAEILLRPLETELDQGNQSQFRPTSLARDAEGFRTGLNLIERIESATGKICNDSSAMRSALLLIGKQHGVSEQ